MTLDYAQANLGTPDLEDVGYTFYDKSGTVIGARVVDGVEQADQPGIYFVTDLVVPANAVRIYWNSASDARAWADDDSLTERRLLQKLDVGTPDQPVIVIPAPPVDSSLCRVYGYFEDIHGQPADGLEIQFTLDLAAWAKADRIIADRIYTAKTNADGRLIDQEGNLWLDLQRNDQIVPSGSRYLVNCPQLKQKNRPMVLSGETQDLAALIVQP